MGVVFFAAEVGICSSARGGGCPDQCGDELESEIAARILVYINTDNNGYIEKYVITCRYTHTYFLARSVQGS